MKTEQQKWTKITHRGMAGTFLAFNDTGQEYGILLTDMHVHVTSGKNRKTVHKTYIMPEGTVSEECRRQMAIEESRRWIQAQAEGLNGALKNLERLRQP